MSEKCTQIWPREVQDNANTFAEWYAGCFHER